MLEKLSEFCEDLVRDFDAISPERKNLLEKLSGYVASIHNKNLPVNLIYICTHNSRRSHFGQLWSQVAAHYYKINNFFSFSGGTEVTAFNPNAVNALKRAGFRVQGSGSGLNPRYKVWFDEQQDPVICFSKVYNDPTNPQTDFAAIMTCGEAEQNCPLIPGAALRIATPYDDPKTYDNTDLQDQKYDERCRQIALETLYAFSRVSGK